MSVRKSKVSAIFICIITMLSLLAMFAPQISHAEADTTLTLICRRDDITLVGMKWKLYRVGERKENEFVLTGDFADYQVNLHDMSAENISTVAKTLESYAIADKIAPISDGRTDENGELKFTGLENGLYLAAGKLLQVGDTYYVPSALLIEVNDEGITFDYDAYPKFYYAVLSGDVKSYAVKKVWADDDNAAQARPVSITVDLYKNDELDDTVILSESNDWEYRWVDLDEDSEWRVVERDVPANYEVSIQFNELQYLIKNSYVTTTDSATTTAPASDSSQTTTVTTTDRAISAGSEKLPQTGQLWWPVLPLSIGGVLLIVAGFIVKPKRKSDEK